MTPTMKKVTPILVVDAIEPCLPFWAALGFEKTVEVPDGDRLGFCILQGGGVELMYQTRPAMQKDLPMFAQLPPATLLYVEVEDVERVALQAAGAPVLVPMRSTFYGAREICVREPGGHAVIFSQQSH